MDQLTAGARHLLRWVRPARGVGPPEALFAATLAGPPAACAQTSDSSDGGAPASTKGLALGFAVDTTAVPGGWWGVDAARVELPAVVRTWRDYLVVRADSAKRAAFWSAADHARAPDPDLPVACKGCLLDARPLFVEALPLVAGDSSRWLLRTVYVGGGTAERPGLLAMERTFVVRELGRDGGPLGRCRTRPLRKRPAGAARGWA